MEKESTLCSWMSNLPDYIKAKPIIKIAIPGSHNSFTYTIRNDSNYSPDNDYPVNNLPFIKRWVKRWCQTQTSDVYDQLFHGIRYLDLRIAKNENQLYWTHGMFGDKIEPGLRQICDFLNKYTEEVIILDFQHFYNFTYEDHISLSTLVCELFKNKICPRPEQLNDLSLQEMQFKKMQVIVVYRHQVVKQPFWESNAWSTPWPNLMSPRKLIQYNDVKIKEKTGNIGHVSQCLLTPKTTTLFINPFGSIKKTCASTALTEIIDWLAKCASNQTFLNVVLADYVELNDYIFSKTVISLNYDYHVLDKVNDASHNNSATAKPNNVKIKEIIPFS